MPFLLLLTCRHTGQTQKHLLFLLLGFAHPNLLFWFCFFIDVGRGWILDRPNLLVRANELVKSPNSAAISVCIACLLPLLELAT